jgi:hypothetical protein
MAIIISYDIPTKHQEFKNAMLQLGYKDQIPGEVCKVIYFPNTTLYHGTKSTDEALKDAKNECEKLRVSLERCVSTKWIDRAAICGEPFK